MGIGDVADAGQLIHQRTEIFAGDADGIVRAAAAVAPAIIDIHAAHAARLDEAAVLLDERAELFDGRVKICGLKRRIGGIDYLVGVDIAAALAGAVGG